MRTSLPHPCRFGRVAFHYLVRLPPRNTHTFLDIAPEQREKTLQSGLSATTKVRVYKRKILLTIEQGLD
jgi:hypothetical protein